MYPKRMDLHNNLHINIINVNIIISYKEGKEIYMGPVSFTTNSKNKELSIFNDFRYSLEIDVSQRVHHCDLSRKLM